MDADSSRIVLACDDLRRSLLRVKDMLQAIAASIGKDEIGSDYDEESNLEIPSESLVSHSFPCSGVENKGLLSSVESL